MKMQDFECQSHRTNRGSRTKHCPFVVFENAREFHLAFYTQIPSSVLKNDNHPSTPQHPPFTTDKSKKL
ncbi:Uncharacterised protein [Corynebacterium ulcerans]|nr:Uncharacterised protein [Corynebacterium ulcerans]